jgi:hypothetical protein
VLNVKAGKDKIGKTSIAETKVGKPALVFRIFVGMHYGVIAKKQTEQRQKHGK